MVLLNIADDAFEFPVAGGFEVLEDGDDAAPAQAGSDGSGIVVPARGWAVIRPH